MPELRQFAKCGVPVALRKTVWEQILRVENSATEKVCATQCTTYDHLLPNVLRIYWQKYFDELERQSQAWELLSDKFVEECLRDTLDDDNYFVFEGKMRKVLLALTRDPELSRDCEELPHSPLGVLHKVI